MKNKRVVSIIMAVILIITLLPAMSASAKVKLNVTNKTLLVGQTLTLKVTGVTGKVKWSSSKSSVATVNQSGKVTAKKVGNTTIKAKIAGQTLKCKIKVKSNGNSSATTGEQNALRKAEAYLEMMAFSYEGLIKQLEYEGFSHSEAIYGADNCGADWKEQAAKKAEAYLEMMGMSKEQLIQQLEYEGFTHAQAVYGAEANGY